MDTFYFTEIYRKYHRKGGRSPLSTRPLDEPVMNIFPYQFSFIHFLAKSSHKLLQSNQRMELGQIWWKEKKEVNMS